MRRRERGQAIDEYALILALIAVVAIGSLIYFGSQIALLLSTSVISSALGH